MPPRRRGVTSALSLAAASRHPPDLSRAGRHRPITPHRPRRLPVCPLPRGPSSSTGGAQIPAAGRWHTPHGRRQDAWGERPNHTGTDPIGRPSRYASTLRRRRKRLRSVVTHSRVTHSRVGGPPPPLFRRTPGIRGSKSHAAALRPALRDETPVSTTTHGS